MKLKVLVPATARVLSLSLVAIGLSLVLVEPALAAGWESAATNVKGFADTAVKAMVALCAVGGVGAVGYAGKLMLKKAGDRGDDVEWSKIGYAVLGGAFLLSIAFVASTTIDTLAPNATGTYKIPAQ